MHFYTCFRKMVDYKTVQRVEVNHSAHKLGIYPNLHVVYPLYNLAPVQTDGELRSSASLTLFGWMLFFPFFSFCSVKNSSALKTPKVKRSQALKRWRECSFPPSSKSPEHSWHRRYTFRDTALNTQSPFMPYGPLTFHPAQATTH